MLKMINFNGLVLDKYCDEKQREILLNVPVKWGFETMCLGDNLLDPALSGGLIEGPLGSEHATPQAGSLTWSSWGMHGTRAR